MNDRLEKYIRSEIIPYFQNSPLIAYMYPNNTSSAVLLSLYLATETEPQRAYRKLKGISPDQMVGDPDMSRRLRVFADWMSDRVPEASEKLKKFIKDNHISDIGDFSEASRNEIYSWCIHGQ